MNALADAPPQREPSERAVLTALKETVSASRLTLFLQCRLRFYFRYVLKLKKARTPALHIGNTVHTVLKEWNRARWLQQPLTLRTVHNVYLEAWADNQTEEPVEWETGEEDQEKTTGWRLVDTYLRENHVPASVKPEAVEVSVEADLVHLGLTKLIGVLDLVQQRRIIDYKTSSTTPNSEKAQHTSEVQTSSYAVLYRHNTGQKEDGIELHHLVKLKHPKVVIMRLPSMSQQQENRLYRQMEAYLDGLQSQRFIPSPGMHCFGCEFFNECRKWH